MLRRMLVLTAVSCSVGCGADALASPHRQGAPDCRASQLLMHSAFGQAATQQLAAFLILTNASTSACSLRGYPSVTLVTAKGRALSFIDHDGGDEPMLRDPQRTVTLHPGTKARVEIVKSTCTFRPNATASFAQLTLAGSRTREISPLDTSIELCRDNDPSGNVLYISPIERS